jgi:hypothetical protein
MKFHLTSFLKVIVIITVVLSSITSSLNAQSVGIGTLTPNGFSMLDISSSNKGLLIPRMALTSTTSNAPVGAFVAGMMVYNTATAGDVTPGFYLCNGTTWEKAGGAGWTLTGNAGTSPSTNFIGTSDNQDVIFKRNNTRAGFLGGSNTAWGRLSMNSTSTGTNNTSIGTGTLLTNNAGSNNTGLGYQSLFSNTTGNNNVGIGKDALFRNTDRSNLVAVGDSALFNNGFGANQPFQSIQNTALGSKALYSNTLGYNNTALGYNALNTNSQGFFNTAVGNAAMIANTNGNSNTAIGNEALSTNTIGHQNTAVGLSALKANTEGNQNIAIGSGSLQGNTTGNSNTALGYTALRFNETGFNNVAIGTRSLFNNINHSDLVAVGDSALYNNGVGAVFLEDATFNTAIGAKAMQSNTTGYYGTAVGYKALMKNTTGRFNTAMGHSALQNLSTHSSANAAFGQGALFTQTGGNGANTAIGVQSLAFITTGNSNTALGWRSGFSNQVGEKNIYIGPEAGYYETGSNKLFIENSNADANNALIYGEFDNNKIRINDKLGIGVVPVSKALEIKGASSTNELVQYYTNAGTAKWHMNILANGGLNFAETDVADQRFVLRAGGNVTIGNKMATGYRLSVDGKIAAEEILVDLDADWPDYVFKADYKLKSLKEVKTYIEKNGHLPNVPSAKEVEDHGILLGNMNKILMEKIEELTLYILKQEEEIQNEKLKMKQLEMRLDKLEKK